MKTVLLIIFCCTTGIFSYAGEIDSLEQALKRTGNYKMQSEISEKLAAAMMATNPDAAVDKFMQSLVFSKADDKLLQEKLIRFTRFMFGLGNLDKATAINNQYLDYFKQKGSNDGQATALYNLGLMNIFQGKINEAGKFLTTAARYCSDNNNQLRVLINSTSSEVYVEQGKYNEALMLLQSTLPLADSVKNVSDYTGVLFTMANIYGKIGDYKTALNHFLHLADKMKALGDPIALANCYSNISSSYASMNRMDSAEKYSRECLQLIEGSNPALVAITLNTLSDILIKQNKLEEAKAYITRLEKIALDTHDPQAQSWVAQSKARILFEEKNYKESIAHLLTALPFIEQGGNLEEMRNGYSLLYKNYAQIGSYENAYTWLAKYDVVKDSLSNESKIKELTLLQSRLENEKREALVKKEKQRQIVVRNSLLGLIVASLIIFLLLFNRQRLKNKNRQQQLLAEKQFAEQELKNATLQLNEIGRNIREKNELIDKAAQEISQTRLELQQLKDQPKTAVTSNIDEATLLRLQDSILLTNEDWDNFTRLFEKVHPDFFGRLKMKLPMLSPAEIRFMALCKLKYAPKDMAGMLGIGRDAIRQYRSRLKKKLELPDEVDFEEMADQI